MNYFVVASDGQKYGPATVDVLNSWVQEGRVQPTTILEDVNTGARFQANQVAGLNFNVGPQSTFQQPNYSQPPSYSGSYMGDNGAKDIQMVWIFSALGFFCCPILSVVAIVFAVKAQQKGHPQSQTALIISVLALVLSGGLCCGLQGALPYAGRFNSFQ